MVNDRIGQLAGLLEEGLYDNGPLESPLFPHDLARWLHEHGVVVREPRGICGACLAALDDSKPVEPSDAAVRADIETVCGYIMGWWPGGYVVDGPGADQHRPGEQDVLEAARRLRAAGHLVEPFDAAVEAAITEYQAPLTTPTYLKSLIGRVLTAAYRAEREVDDE